MWFQEVVQSLETFSSVAQQIAGAYLWNRWFHWCLLFDTTPLSGWVHSSIAFLKCCPTPEDHALSMLHSSFTLIVFWDATSTYFSYSPRLSSATDLRRSPLHSSSCPTFCWSYEAAWLRSHCEVHAGGWPDHDYFRKELWWGGDTVSNAGRCGLINDLIQCNDGCWLSDCWG